MEFDPSKRITVEEALAHPYLSAYHDEDDEVSLSFYLWYDIFISNGYVFFYLQTKK